MDQPLILYIDDDSETRDACAVLLRHAGFRVIEASDGVEGVGQLEQKPDLVLLDLKTATADDGYETLREIRRNASVSGIPVIALSGLPLHADGVPLCDRCLVKPQDMADIVQTARDLLVM